MPRMASAVGGKARFDVVKFSVKPRAKQITFTVQYRNLIVLASSRLILYVYLLLQKAST